MRRFAQTLFAQTLVAMLLLEQSLATRAFCTQRFPTQACKSHLVLPSYGAAIRDTGLLTPLRHVARMEGALRKGATRPFLNFPLFVLASMAKHGAGRHVSSASAQGRRRRRRPRRPRRTII